MREQQTGTATTALADRQAHLTQYVGTHKRSAKRAPTHNAPGCTAKRASALAGDVAAAKFGQLGVARLLIRAYEDNPRGPMSNPNLHVDNDDILTGS